jgi:hypothetical protein
MHKWWWWWLPGWHKRWKLEKQNWKLAERRTEVLSQFAERRHAVLQMAQRPRHAGDTLNARLLRRVLRGLAAIEASVRQAATTEAINELDDAADQQETLMAYLCPQEEIRIEGHLAIELMEWWGVPKSETNKLRELLMEQLDKANGNPDGARSALHALFRERDDWDEYRNDYEDEMRGNARCLFWATMVLPPIAVIAFYFAYHFPPLLIGGLLLAGVAGSCVSVARKLPALEVSLSEKLDSYDRRIWSRISVGTAASLIGCGLLAAGIVSITIHGQTFADLLDACSNHCSIALPTSCTALRIVILLAVPMLFGFSERALTSFEGRVFGKPTTPKRP